MNGLSNLDATYREYFLAPINDLIRCQSQVTMPSRWRPRSGVTTVHLL